MLPTWDSPKKSYSQSGEDLIAQFVFNAIGIQQPSYLDIGAYHPKLLSNTALFYEQGSRGINIEANPLLLKNFHEQRPEDINLNIGVGSEEEVKNFYVISTPTLSTFNQEEANNLHHQGIHTIKEIIPIEVKTIQSVLVEYTENIFPEFLSLDVEGWDLEILKTINYAKNAPALICVETISFSENGDGKKNQEIIDFLKSQGFLIYADTFINTIFVQESLWKQQGKKSVQLPRVEINRQKISSVPNSLPHDPTYLLQQIEALQNRVEAMESSKFWKLRKLWFKVKRLFGISDNESEPSPLSLPESAVSPTFNAQSVEDSSLGGDGAGSNTLSSPAAESSLPIAISDTPPTEPPKPTAATLKIGTLNEQTRDRWIETILTNLSPGLRLLDAGCGEQQYKRFCSHLTYVGQDFGEYNGEGDSLGLQTGAWDNSKLDIVSDITAIPEPDNSFDVILCTEVFEHIPNPIAALEEFTRLLRPGGQLILTAPFCSLTHFSPFHFHSGFNVYFYEHALGKLGYKLTEVDRNGNFFEYLAQEVRRIPYCSQTYSEAELSYADFGTIDAMLALLDRINQTNQKSEELLCFGYHIVAIKESSPSDSIPIN